MSDIIQKANVNIGLEIHMRLNTKTKLWSGSKNVFTDKPNENISAIDLGISGASSLLNAEAVNKAIRLALLMNCKISDVSYFDRKQYLYVDIPSGYQITQFYQPYATNGNLCINGNNIIISEMHLESDAGKIVNENNHILLDYNRAGCPLIELVTGVCFTTSDQVIDFLEYLIRLIRFMNISDANLELGNLRVDVNISCTRPDHLYGTRGEIKNLNSLSAIRKAIELVRATRFTETLSQAATLQYDVNNNVLTKMRDKECANDYAYIRDGTISPLIISKNHIDQISQEMHLCDNKIELKEGELRTPKQIYDILKAKGINDEIINTLLDNMALYKFFTKLKTQNIYSANICVGIISGYINEIKNEINEVCNVIEFVLQYIPNKVSINNANNALKIYMSDRTLNINDIIKNYMINDNVEIITKIFNQVISQNEKEWNTYRNTKEEKILNVLIGKMRKIDANVSISITKDIIAKHLNINSCY